MIDDVSWVDDYSKVKSLFQEVSPAKSFNTILKRIIEEYLSI